MHAIIACQLLTTITILITMIRGKTLKSKNETLKQTLILAITKKTVLIVAVSVPHMANAMPMHMVKTALYPIIIQFDEETIQLK